MLCTDVFVPPYHSHHGAQAVSCSYKAATGLLYPLERGFIFVYKPPIHIRFDEVVNVNFARSAGSTRSFDFEVDTQNGASYTFVGVEKWVTYQAVVSLKGKSTAPAVPPKSNECYQHGKDE